MLTTGIVKDGAMSNRVYAFLRAINTGRRRLTNEALLSPFHELGLARAEAYQASGNVSFLTDRDPFELEGELNAALSTAYGFETPVFLRTEAELNTVLGAVPFSDEQLAATEGRPQLTFLSTPPSSDRWAQVAELVSPTDLVASYDRHWFWLPQRGVSTSELPVTQIERILGPMTMRTVGSVERMVRRFTDR